MINIPNERLKEIVNILNYSRQLLVNKEPNEIIDDLEDIIQYLDNLVVD